MDAQPFCIYQPRGARDVSMALVPPRYTSCPFAVKSGGHGMWEGQSSISLGVTIDLAYMNHLELSEDRSSVSVGPGSRWVDVYTALEPLGLLVVGGRSAYVGVGGFLLGGGISFYSNMYGWVLDNIQSFEVVLGNGTIVTASETVNPELYKALRGGTGNFGIVTSFTLDTYPYTGTWGGHRIYSIEEEDALIDILLDYGQKTAEDPKASLIIAPTTYQGEWLMYTDIVYCESVENPPFFDKLNSLPALVDDTGLKDQSTRTMEMAMHYPNGLYNTMWVFATKVDASIIKLYNAVCIREANKLRDIAGMKMTAVTQLITASTISKMTRRGGNSLGLESSGAFLMFNIELQWTDKSQSQRVIHAMETVTKEVQAEAEHHGLAFDYLYANYASPWQHPHGSQGRVAEMILAKTVARYDSDGVFQRLRGSGFKLGGAPRTLLLQDTKGIEPESC